MGLRPFRFGVNLRGVPSAAEWADQCRHAEDHGYAVLSVSDHLTSRLGAIPALTAAAAATRVIRVCPLVLNNDMRHPAMLAQDLATLDVLSGGRLEIGLGAGWRLAGYQQSGVTFDPAAVRVQRLAESVSVMTGLFGDGPYSFKGQHYQIDGLVGQPAPIQRPHPPILIGGGSRRILELAGRVADIVGVHVDLASGDLGKVGPNTSVDQTLHKVDWIRAAAGERFDQLELQMSLFKVATSNLDLAARETAASFGMQVEHVALSPHVAFGSVAQIVEALQERRERFGVSYFTVMQPDLEVFAAVAARLAGT